MSEHLSTLRLNQLRYGELEEADEAAARAHLDECEQCSQRLVEQSSNREAFVLEPVPTGIHRIGPANDVAGFLRRVAPVVGVLAGLWLLVSVLPSSTDPSARSQRDPVEQTRTKGGGVMLEAWVATTDGPKVLKDGAAVSAGDTVQLRFESEGGLSWVSLGGVDGAGQAEVYGTLGANDSVQTAPFALTLDQTPGEQRLYAVFSSKKLSDEQVRQSLRSEAAPSGGVLRKITLRKD